MEKKTRQPFGLSQQFTLHASRRLPNLPSTHPCSQLHGHSFKITFIFKGFLKKNLEWFEDYYDIEKGLLPLLKRLDHRFLNEVEGLQNPTTENLCYWLYQKAQQVFPSLHQVSVAETENTLCIYPMNPNFGFLQD